MIYPLTDLNSWPLRRPYDPIFKTTNDAFLYARLIVDLEKYQKPLVFFRQQTIRSVKHEQQKENPEWDHLMALAARAQFYRECLEEVERIKISQPGYFTNPRQELTNA